MPVALPPGRARLATNPSLIVRCSSTRHAYERNQLKVSGLSGMSVQVPYKPKQSVPLFTAIIWTMGALAAGCFVVALLNLREPEIGPTVVAGDTAFGGPSVMCFRAGWCYDSGGRKPSP
jgi:hypothetical protein